MGGRKMYRHHETPDVGRDKACIRRDTVRRVILKAPVEPGTVHHYKCDNCGKKWRTTVVWVKCPFCRRFNVVVENAL